MIFTSILKQDYDHRVSIEKRNVLCYSKKKLRALYPDGNFRIVGEAHRTKAPKNAQNAPQKPDNALGEYALDETKKLTVSPVGTKNRFLYKKSGYVCVGDGAYLALLVSRAPFLLSILGVIATFAIALGLIFGLKEGGVFGDQPPIINPDHPLPPEDENSLPIEGDDNDEKLESEEGGGAVSMIYTKSAKLHLSTKKIDVYFLNPYRSNHDVVFHLTLISGDQAVRIASSGRLVPGKGLLIMEFDVRSAQLSEGTYTGIYEVYFYDPETGERAVLASKLEGVTVTVTNE